jgi:hypothetical protein
MGDKPCTGKLNDLMNFIINSKFFYLELAGIGETLGKRLETAGFDKVIVLMFFLTILTKNKQFTGIHSIRSISDSQKRFRTFQRMAKGHDQRQL